MDTVEFVSTADTIDNALTAAFKSTAHGWTILSVSQEYCILEQNLFLIAEYT